MLCLQLRCQAYKVSLSKSMTEVTVPGRRLRGKIHIVTLHVIRLHVAGGK